MDAGVNELEFSTLRSMRSGVNGDLSNMDQQQDTLATAAAATQQPHSRQVSSQGARHTTSETVAADGLPREVLVAPPQPPSNLELDNASLAHLQKLIKQSVENVGLQERTWEDLLAPLPTEILALIDDQVIRQLARTKRALAKADLQYELARAELKAQDGKPGKTSATASSTTAKKEKKVVEGESDADDSDTKNNTKRKKADAISQLDVEETARHLLLEELTAEHAKRIEASAEGREPTQEIEGLPKLTKFLICVSEDVGSTRRLTFDANAFTGAPLFQGDDEDEKDAEKFIINEEVYAYVGGTIHLKAPEREWNRIEKILTLLIYAACHLKLEVHLLRDSGCPRPPPLPGKEEVSTKPAVTREASDSTIHAEPAPKSSPEIEASSPLSPIGEFPLSPVTSTSSDEERPAAKSHSKKWSRSGLVSLLFRDRTPAEPVNKLKKRFGGRLKMHRTRSIHRKSEDVARAEHAMVPKEEPLRMPGAFTLDDWELVAPEKKVVVNMARNEEEQAGETLTAPGSPSDTKPPSPLPTLANTALDNIMLHQQVEESAHERFKRVIERMKKAVLSVSPDVHFPPPSLLQSLREQEQQQHTTEGIRMPGRPLLGRLHSYTGEKSPSMSAGLADGLPTSASVPALLSSEPVSAAAPNTAATKISIDTRAGLASLMTGNNSLDGTFRHQAIPCLFEKLAPDAKVPNSLCQPPLWRKLVYYDYEKEINPWSLTLNLVSASMISIGDVSLSSFCTLMSKASNEACSAGCGKAWAEHTFSVIHVNRKINITLKQSLLASSAPERMLHWIVCSLCGKRTETVALSEASLAISFGKFLELLLYDAAFHPPQQEFCPHSEDPFSLTRTFLRNGMEVRVKQDSVNLYTLRMPTSVEPNTASPLNNRIHNEDSLNRKRTELLQELKVFFASVYEIRKKLSDPFSDETEEVRNEVEKLLEELDVSELSRLEEDLIFGAESVQLEEINDSRYHFSDICHRYTAKFDAFRKSRTVSAGKDLPRCELVLPEYVEHGDIHVLPTNSSVILREKELSSFIAYTLTAKQYHEVISSGDCPASVDDDKVAVHNTPSELSIPSSEACSVASSQVSPAASAQSGPARVFERAHKDWELSAKVKKTVKPSGSILSLKATTPRARLQDIFSLADGNRSRQPSPASGSRSAGKAEEDDKVLEALLSATKASSPKPSPLGPSKAPALPSLITSLTSRRHVSEATATTAASDTSATSSLAPMDISVQHGRAESVRSVSTVNSEVSDAGTSSDTSTYTVRDDDVPLKETAKSLPQASTAQPAVAAKGSAFSTISGFLNRGLRINHPDMQEKTESIPKTSTGPHVKLTFRHEHKKMSCIVYYAQQFAALRQACGLPEALYAKSLERSNALQFLGGKTNAGFWLSRDERLVLKEMRTTWNVSEVDAMLTFAPNYLNYLMHSDRPSLLTKIFGMYTCKIKNLKTGEKQKVDFVVMEHLFFDQNITTKFDLKGISTRVARAKGEGQTLWDADWVENFQTRLLVHAHEKTILREAIAADVDFLQQNNVMDYSALVGVDDKNHTLTIGLIDTLGIFNLAKAIESNSKRVLQAERTIIPPEEYAARFQKALDEYFIASPEKFSKSPGEESTPALHCPL